MTTYTENCSRTFDENHVRVVNLKQLISNWFRNQQLKSQVSLERRQLSQMSDAMLRDIGIDRLEAQTEAQRIDIPASRSQLLSTGK